MPSLIRLALDVGLLVVAGTAAAFFVWATFARRRTVVLGAELAAARAAEEDRIAAGGYGPSPLEGKAYRLERGELSLMRLVPSELDGQISELAATWKASDSIQRERIRRSLTMDDNYTLIQFAKRIAVRALNPAPGASCDDGLSALAMIDESRIDARDGSLAAGLLSHAAGRLESAGGFDRAIGLATPGMAECIRRGMRWTLKDCGYREWRSAGEIGLVQSGTARYEPAVDLVAVAQRIGVHVLDGRYVVGDVEVATTLPPVWFSRAQQAHAAGVMARSRGTACLHAYRRSTVTPAKMQSLMMWVVELQLSADGAALVSDVGDGDRGGKFVVGIASGHLFVLVVAGSFQQGVPPFESAVTVRGLGSQIQRCLEDAGKSTRP